MDETWVYNTGGVILTEDVWSTILEETPVPVPLLSITDHTYNGLESNPALRGDKPATNFLNYVRPDEK